MTRGEVIGESEDELKELVWLVAKEEEDDYEEEYEHGSDYTDESEGKLCDSFGE